MMRWNGILSSVRPAAPTLIAVALSLGVGCGTTPAPTSTAGDTAVFEIGGGDIGGRAGGDTQVDSTVGDSAGGDGAVASDTGVTDAAASDANADAVASDAAGQDAVAAETADAAADTGDKTDAVSPDAAPDVATDTAADGASCKPDCKDLECGSDGCGGTCGKCPAAAPECVVGICSAACVGSCTGKICGDDGCDGSCGVCGPATYCKAGTSCAPGTECAAMAGCSVACGSDDKCLEGCFEFGTIDGLLDLSDWQSCLLTNCFAAKNALSCISQKCLTEFVTCYAGKPGTGTCKELSTCSGPCGGDLSCIGICQAKATLPASGAYLKYLACIAEVCPKGSDSNCAATALGPSGGCKADYDACINN